VKLGIRLLVWCLGTLPPVCICCSYIVMFVPVSLILLIFTYCSYSMELITVGFILLIFSFFAILISFSDIPSVWLVVINITISILLVKIINSMVLR
jgi:hypothetical protein